MSKKSATLIPKIIQAGNTEQAITVLNQVLKSLHFSSDYLELVSLKDELDDYQLKFNEVCEKCVQENDITILNNIRIELNFLFREITDKLVFPINKSLWSSSYVLYTGGLATLILTLLYHLIEVAHYKKWTKFFLIWGINPMIVFFLSGIVPRAWIMIEIQNPELASDKLNSKEYFYNYGIAPLFSNPLNASLAFALLYVLFWTVILWFFYKNKHIFKV